MNVQFKKRVIIEIAFLAQIGWCSPLVYLLLINGVLIANGFTSNYGNKRRYLLLSSDFFFLSFFSFVLGGREKERPSAYYCLAIRTRLIIPYRFCLEFPRQATCAFVRTQNDTSTALQEIYVTINCVTIWHGFDNSMIPFPARFWLAPLFDTALCSGVIGESKGTVIPFSYSPNFLPRRSRK